jgi:hypothetical protein
MQEETTELAQESESLDMLAAGLRDSGTIVIVKFDELSEKFETVSRIKLDLDQGKILCAYDKLFSYEDKLLFGFGKIGSMKVWKIEDLDNVHEADLTYRQIQISKEGCVVNIQPEPEPNMSETETETEGEVAAETEEEESNSNLPRFSSLKNFFSRFSGGLLSSHTTPSDPETTTPPAENNTDPKTST